MRRLELAPPGIYVSRSVELPDVLSSRVRTGYIWDSPPVNKNEVIIDAAGHVAGRLASYVAKWLLSSDKLRVIVINSQDAVITGDFNMVLEWIKRRISEWRTHYNPEKVGPKYPRRPDRIFKRIVRGMVPRKQWKGRYALKRLRVYMGYPPELFQRKRIDVYLVVPAIYVPRPLAKYVTLGEIWRHIEPIKWERWLTAQRMYLSWLASRLAQSESKTNQV